jgi:monoterpene epsilon-lactone hydrolase
VDSVCNALHLDFTAPGGKGFFVDKVTLEAQAPSPKTVSREAQQLLESLVLDAGPQNLKAHRDMCAGVQLKLGGSLLERHSVSMEESFLAGVPVRIFTPLKIPDQNRDAVLLNLHGGGFTVDAGSVTENVPIAAFAQMRVVAARYRLAPEHAFPAAVDDAEAVYRALLETHAAKRIGLYGTSAGACLCAQLLVRVRETGGAWPHAFGFFTGTADLSRTGDSEFFFRPAGDPALTEDQFSAYLKGSDRFSAQVSPIFSNLTGLPPTLCIAGTRDFMLSQTSLFHLALLRAGVDARLLVFEAMPHAHWIFLDLPESTQAFRAMADFFAEQLAR